MRSATISPYEGHDPFIFISYAHKDSSRVIPVLEKMTESGYRLWYDDGIAPGSEWPEYIAEHLNASHVVLAFVSPESMESPNCRREVTYALSKRKPFLGVVLEETELSPGMELQLSAHQCILRHNHRTDEAFVGIILSSDILKPCLKSAQENDAAGPSVPEEVSLAQPPETKSNNSGKKPFIFIPVALLALLAIILFATGVFKKKTPVDPASESTRGIQTESAAATEAASRETTTAPSTEVASAETTTAPATETASPESTASEEKVEEPLKGELERIMSLNMDPDRIKLIAAGVAYWDDKGLIGLKSFDSVSDTGAVYPLGAVYGQYKDYEGRYLIVSQNGSSWEKTPQSLNRYGLVDARGREIIPEAYASIIHCSEYYAICIKVTEETADEAAAVCSLPVGLFESNAQDGNIHFRGEWTLIALPGGQPVPGFSGTRATEYTSLQDGLKLYGEVIEAKYNTKYIRADGSELPAGAKVLKDGSYYVSEPSRATVYRSDGTALFHFDPNEYTLSYDTGGSGYFIRRKLSDGYTYQLLDKSGQIQSAEITISYKTEPKTLGPYILFPSGLSDVASKIYDLNGKLLTDQELYNYGGHEYEALHHILKLKTADEGYLFFTDEGELLLEVEKDEAKVNGFLVSRNGIYYNFRTETYDIDGRKVWDNLWVSVVNDGGRFDLVDAFSGATLLRGYESYHVVNSPEYGTIIAAFYNQTLDIFVLK